MPRFRTPPKYRTLLAAYATSGVSKIGTLAVQLIALPVAVGSIGVERFGAMMALAAIGSFVAIPAQGFSPSTSFGLASALGKRDQACVRREFWTPVLLALCLALVALALIAILALLIPADVFLNTDELSGGDDLFGAKLALAAHVFFLYLSAPVVGARSAFEENHYSNVLATIAALAVLGTCLLLARMDAHIGAFYLAIFVMPLAFQTANLAWMMMSRRDMLGMPSVDRDTFAAVLQRSMRFSKTQVGFVAHVHGSVYLVNAFAGLGAGAVVGAVQRLFVLSQSTFVSLLYPVLSIVSRALGSEDRGEVRLLLRIVLAATVIAPLCIAVGFALLGDQILTLWMGPDFSIPHGLAITFGVFFFGYSATGLAYAELLSIDQADRVSWYYVASGVLAMAINLSGLLPRSSGFIIATSALTMILVNGIPALRTWTSVMQELADRIDERKDATRDVSQT